MLTKFLDPKNDVAFKKIFGTEKNKGLLISFLNEVLQEQIKHKITKVTFLKTEQDPETAAKKQSIIDVLCEDQTGIKYIIEMQVAKAAGFEKRAQVYASRAYLSQLDKKNKKDQEHNYEDLKEVIFVALTNYIAFPHKKAYKSCHVTMDKLTHEQDIKGFSFTFVELPKFERERKAAKKKLKDLGLEDKWYYFLKNAPETTEEDLEQLTKKDAAIKDAYKALDRFGWSDSELLAYDQEVKRVMDNAAVERQQIKDAKAAGVAEGIAEEAARGEAKLKAQQLETAKTLLKSGVDMKTTANATGLTEEVIKKLAKS
jgi:predicted transposase/invertase (TIGR01784 family)